MRDKKDKIPVVKGTLRIFVKRRGEWVKVVERKNVITNSGLSQSIKLIFGLDTSYFQYIAIGTGTTPPSESDTQLENEIQRFSATAEYSDPYNVILKVTMEMTQSASITEAGVFNKDTGGVMLARQTFDAVNVEAGDLLKIEWEFSF